MQMMNDASQAVNRRKQTQDCMAVMDKYAFVMCYTIKLWTVDAGFYNMFEQRGTRDSLHGHVFKVTCFKELRRSRSALFSKSRSDILVIWTLDSSIFSTNSFLDLNEKTLLQFFSVSSFVHTCTYYSVIF